MILTTCRASAIAVADVVGCLELYRNAEFILPGLESADAAAVAVAAAPHHQRCCGSGSSSPRDESHGPEAAHAGAPLGGGSSRLMQQPPRSQPLLSDEDVDDDVDTSAVQQLYQGAVKKRWDLEPLSSVDQV